MYILFEKKLYFILLIVFKCKKVCNKYLYETEPGGELSNNKIFVMHALYLTLESLASAPASYRNQKHTNRRVQQKIINFNLSLFSKTKLYILLSHDETCNIFILLIDYYMIFQ